MALSVVLTVGVNVGVGVSVGVGVRVGVAVVSGVGVGVGVPASAAAAQSTHARTKTKPLIPPAVGVLCIVPLGDRVLDECLGGVLHPVFHDSSARILLRLSDRSKT